MNVPPPAGPPTVLWGRARCRSCRGAAAGLLVFNLLPVVPLTIGSALLMWLVSMATPAPGPAPWRATSEACCPDRGASRRRPLVAGLGGLPPASGAPESRAGAAS
jgi:hypothetical protein